jgi:CDP-diacylglycerol---glycerol-3-phosphate 3-phosphatidyltransferase
MNNLPNLLTLSRLVLALVMMLLLASTFPFSKTLALLVFVVAGITDYLDGFLARRLGVVSAFGRLMDPLTDKVMVSAAFVSFVEIQTAHVRGWSHALVPAWIVVIIITREFLVTGLRLVAAQRGNVIPAGAWGKHKTVWQIVAIVAILLGLAIRHDLLRGADARVLANFDFAFAYTAFAVAVAVAIITVATGGMYFYEHRDLVERRH